MLPVQILQQHILGEEEANGRIRLLNNQRRLLRDQSDVFGLPDGHFVKLFRLRKDMAYYLCQRLTPYISGQDNPLAIRADLKIFVTLSFLATGTYQRPIGQNFHFPMGQATVSNCVREVTNLICTHMANEWITFPTEPADIQRMKMRFRQAAGFPGTLGAVDCTHVAITAPTQDEHNYLNRKGFHSKNIQIICDYDLRIININPRYTGATHDAYIWRNSVINAEMERRYNEGDHDTWLIGDSGYPQQPWLMTPITHAVPDTPEGRYTAALVRARACIERCNGVLKGHFRCITGERVLHYNPQAVASIVVTCAVLHNICIDGRLPFGQNADYHEEDHNDEVLHNNLERNGERPGVLARRRVISNYFA